MPIEPRRAIDSRAKANNLTVASRPISSDATTYSRASALDCLNRGNTLIPTAIPDTKSTSSSHPLDPKAAAEYLLLDVKTITRWARQGYLPAHPLGEGKRKFWRFLEHELAAWLAAKNNAPRVA